MTTFLTCINEAAAAGDLDPDVAAEARATYEDAHATASETFGPIDADRLAAEATMKALEAAALEAKRRRALMIRTRREALEGIAGYKRRRGYQNVADLGGGRGRPPKGGWVQGGEVPPEGPHSGGAKAARALELMVENKPGLSGGPFASIEGRYRAIRGKADAMMASLIERFETKTGFDRPGRAVLSNVVKEAFGEDTGDVAAKALAQAWTETAEHLRRQFNAAGGAIGKLDGWGLPQWHDAVRVREAGKEAWIEAILPRLDRSKMVDRLTGQPFSEARLRGVLGETWAKIGSGGAIARKPGEGLGQGMLAKRRGEERFLAFKSADDWHAYQSEFGENDAFAAMMGHIDEMARDVAQMQILGPNPAHQFEWLKKFAQREADIEELNGAKGAADRAKGYIETADDMMAHFTGAASTPVNTKLSGFGVSTRAYLTSVTLGSAILSDIPSAPYFGAMARQFSGLSRTGSMAAFMGLLVSPANRATARRSGFIIEQATDGFVRATHDNLRLVTVGEKASGGANAFARRLPAAVLRLQGLTPYVAARKRAFRFEFMGALHDRRGMTIAQMKAGDGEDAAMAAWLEARGFSEADWTIIRAAPTWKPGAGAAFLRPTDVADESLALRLSEGIELETRFAAPETTLWTRAKLIGKTRPGTWRGEYLRSWAMFRSFTITATQLYAEETALRGIGNTAAATAFNTATGLGSILVFLTIAGAAAIQLRETVKGNDPRPVDDPAFWGAALLQGGGLGIFGDFLYAATARNGRTAPAAAYGPVGQVAGDIGDLTVGNVVAVTEGLKDGDNLAEAAEGARLGRDAATMIRRYTPLSSLWWTRTAWSRAVADQVQRQLDPEADASFRQRARRLERDMQQGQWWAEGEATPGRAPDWANIAPAGDDPLAP